MNKTKEKIGMQVIKRDGSCVDYDRSKIATAIRKANAEVEDSEKISEEKIGTKDDGREEVRPCQNLYYLPVFARAGAQGQHDGRFHPQPD